MKYAFLILAMLSGCLFAEDALTPVPKGALEMKQQVGGKPVMVSGRVVDQDDTTYKVLRFTQGTKQIYQVIAKDKVNAVLPDYVFETKKEQDRKKNRLELHAIELEYLNKGLVFKDGKWVKPETEQDFKEILMRKAELQKELDDNVKSGEMKELLEREKELLQKVKDLQEKQGKQ